MIKGNMNFLVCFWKIITREIKKINSTNGILFPDKIIPEIKIKNKTGINKAENLLEIFL